MFKEYLLSDLFSIERGTRLTKSNRISGDRALVTAGYENYGIAEFISNIEQEIFKSNTITIDMFANVFYRDEEYSADDNILVLTANFKMNKKIGLFITSMIKIHLQSTFSYGKQYRQKDFKLTEITLPTTAEGGIDFVYMDNYIRELESERLRELEAFLEVTGLSNYKLTKKEEKALNKLNGGG